MTTATQTRTNPFPGLRPFEAEEDHLFFGREGQTDELLRRLRSRRFLAVVGTSGSGKSSLVRAGLLPALYSGFMAGVGSSWRVALLRPGNAPIANLAEALNHEDVLGSEGEDQRLQTIITETVLRRGALGLVEAVQQSRLPAAENLLVVVDQFEELFRFKQQSSRVLLNSRMNRNEVTIHPTLNSSLESATPSSSEASGDEAAAFVKLLLEATQQTALPIYVVLTMRSDFLGECAQFRDLPETMNDSQYLIPRMTRDQQRQAIEAPVAVGGATITPRLVSRLLNDVGDNPDQLPILQHALMRTWDYWMAHHQGSEPIDVPDYEAIGGMARALSQHGDELYDGLPDDRTRLLTERLFRCLTEKGSDGRGIRRPTRLRDAGAIAGATEAEIIALVEAFRTRSGTFLTPPLPTPLQADSMLDISHESLMRVWQRLDGWVEAESQSAQIYRRLADTAELYQQERAGLLRDPELTIALNWRQEQQPNAAWAERYAPHFEQTMQFLDDSVTARDEEAAAKEANRKRELQRLRLFLAGLGLLSFLALGAAAFAFQQKRLADQQTLRVEQQKGEVTQQRDIAKQQEQNALQQKQVADDQRQQADKQKQEAIKQQQIAELQKKQAVAARSAEAKQKALALAAQQLAEQGQAAAQTQTKIAEQQTQKAIAAKAIADTEKTNADINFQSVAAQNLLTSNLELESLIAAIKTGQQVQQLEKGKTLKPDTRMRAIATLRQVVYGVNERNRLEGHSRGVSSVSFSPDGKTLATGSEDNTVKLWDGLTGRAVQTLKGHSSRVSSVSFSPDGKTLATGSDDNTVKLWDVATGRELQTLKGHSSSVTSVSFSPDGKTLATGSWDATVKLWDVQAGRELQTLKGHGSIVRSVSFSPDGKTLATGSDDNTVKLWDVATGRELQTLKGHSSRVSSVRFSPDSKTLATGSADDTVKLWDVATGRAVQTLATGSADDTVNLWDVVTARAVPTLKGHSSRVSSVSFSPDGKTLATSSDDTKLWDVATGRELQTLKGHSGSVLSVSFSPDGKTLATGSADNTVKLWDVQAGRELQTLKGHSSSVSSVRFSPDSKTLAAGSADDTVKLWDVATGRAVQTLRGHSNFVLSVSFSPDGKTLATSSDDSTVKLWDVATGRAVQTLPAERSANKGHSSFVSSVSFSPDGKTLATGSADTTVKLWDVATGRAVQTLKGHGSFVSSVSFSPDGKTLATGSADTTVKLWDVQAGRELQTLKGHSSRVLSVSFSPDSKTLATRSADNTVKLWDVATGRAVPTLKGHSSRVSSVSFSPDGKTLATSSDDTKLWDVATGRELQTLKGHSSFVNSVSFSPDGKTLATGSEDTTVKLWDVQAGRELQTLKGHSSGVLSVSFSPDGKTLATGADTTVILWNLNLDDLLVRGCGWIHGYLQNNPNVSQEDKHLCDGVRPPAAQPGQRQSMQPGATGWWVGVWERLRGWA